jgi:integrase
MEAWVFHPSEHKTGRTGRPLVVNLTPSMVAMTKTLIEQYPEGPLFRNSYGRPWKKDAIKDAIRKLRNRLGLPEKFVATSFRHGFTTDGLLNGLGAETMAQLLGHTDSSMVNRHYGHLDQKATFLRGELRKLSEGRRISESSPCSPPEKPESEAPPAGHPDN